MTARGVSFRVSRAAVVSASHWLSEAPGTIIGNNPRHWRIVADWLLYQAAGRRWFRDGSVMLNLSRPVAVWLLRQSRTLARGISKRGSWASRECLGCMAHSTDSARRSPAQSEALAGGSG